MKFEQAREIMENGIMCERSHNGNWLSQAYRMRYDSQTQSSTLQVRYFTTKRNWVDVVFDTMFLDCEWRIKG